MVAGSSFGVADGGLLTVKGAQGDQAVNVSGIGELGGSVVMRDVDGEITSHLP